MTTRVIGGGMDLVRAGLIWSVKTRGVGEDEVCEMQLNIPKNKTTLPGQGTSPPPLRIVTRTGYPPPPVFPPPLLS